ncbi:hypothetical protein O6H91_07G003300 [Diphasiastrum complanatum]|uniref:Uncharacterized protein n=3 Tax=Diphasiastrum complanatum TaxID=34168 RepID=A0ACC2D1S4_DIPCM|nr:hypothetical protein O6H91_07G003300 [Diphasiastrum complanatum]KAJ7548222.1 hypothetical protein O6H91_07G003300 [Diphasiastrum complanatum]KAJ7548225.1 hypothetical protein O6H91_07G003300 [Diphasiastrum complanatum]
MMRLCFPRTKDKDDTVNVLQASSAVAESEREVKNPGCIPSMQNTDCVKSTQFTLAQTSVSASEGLPPRDPLEEKSLCCKCGKSLPLHCKGSIERSLSESAVCKRDCMPFSEGPEADEATAFSSLKDALTKLEKEHDALICLQEATEKKNQELLLREQESQRELWLLQQRHEEALKSLQSMKEKPDSLIVPSSSLKGNKLSVHSLEKDLIGTGDCATTSSDKQRTEYCNGSIDMKKAYEVGDRFIEEVQSDEVGSSPHKGAPITVDSVEGAQQLEGQLPYTSSPIGSKGRAAMIEDMPGSHCFESYEKETAIAGASSSVSELAKQEGESYALETCTDAPNQNAVDSGLPLLTYATAVEKLSIPCMSPLTPDRRALFCCIDKDISERKCTTVQNREGRSEAINKIPESLGPDTPEKTVPHVAGCHPFRTFTTSVPNTSTIEKDVSCSTCQDKDVPAEEAKNANLEPSTLFSSAEAPAYLQRAKEPRENLQAACLDKDLVQTSAGKSFLLESSPQDFFPAKEFLKDLEFVAHEDLDSFGTSRKARATMGCGNARRRIMAESSDSESGRDVIGNSRPKKRAFRNHLDSENENQFAYSKERIIAIPSDSESGEEDRGYLKDSCYCEPLISDEVFKETPVLKRLKKFGSINLLGMINNQALEEAADKLGSSISKGEGQRDVLNIGGARRRRRRIFQDSEDEAGNSCHDRQQLCEELEEEEIDPHPAKSKTLISGKSVVGKMHLPGTSNSSENPKGYWLTRFGKRRLSYSEAPILEDGSTGEASSHGQKVRRHKRHVKEKVKLYVNLLKESSGSEGEDEIEEESEGESLKGFIVDEIEESEDWGKPNSLSENRSTDGLEDICSASTDELQCSPCSSESSQNGKFNWAHEAQFLAALGRDDELCLHAVCALYRQQTYSEQMNKSALIRNRRGFDRFHASKASVVAEFLTDGDYAGELKKSVMDLKRHDPQGIEYCRDIAFHYSKQLFEIYQNGEDPYFCARTEC